LPRWPRIDGTPTWQQSRSTTRAFLASFSRACRLCLEKVKRLDSSLCHLDRPNAIPAHPRTQAHAQAQKQPIKRADRRWPPLERKEADGEIISAMWRRSGGAFYHGSGSRGRR
jgi:hypothetical protein